MQIKPRNDEQRMALDLLLDENVQLVSLIGKAGTGKTLLTLAAALSQSKRYSRILLSKPVIDLGKGIGFLPGDMGEKMAPWMASYYDNLDQIPDLVSMQNAVLAREELLEKYRIELNPINYVRGRSLKGAFMVIDEAQNLTQHEIKSIITRAGEGTKVVLLGDPQQIDVSYLDKNSNGLAYVTTRMKGQPLFGSVTLKKSERSSLADIAADLL
jgi:PhoH-like ATPase